MKNFYVKRLLSLIVLSLAVAAYSFAQERYSFTGVDSGSKKGLVNIYAGFDLGDSYDEYMVENCTDKMIFVYTYGNGADEDATSFSDLPPNEDGVVSLITKNYFMTPWPVEGCWGHIVILVNDIKEKESNRYYIEGREIDGGNGGNTYKFTVYKAN